MLCHCYELAFTHCVTVVSVHCMPMGKCGPSSVLLVSDETDESLSASLVPVL